MSLTELEQEAKDKIISFDYEELREWIHSRLQGFDRHFPIDLASKSDPGQFLVKCFFGIKNDRFQENFLKILNHLTQQLKNLSRVEIKKSKGYISRLLSLCGKIPGFKPKDALLEIAVPGKFANIKAEGRQLHAWLLDTLASHEIAGSCEFWLEQLLENTDKDCAFPAFFALKGYPDRLFEHMTAIIDKYKRKIEPFIWGIILLINTNGRKIITGMFKRLENDLSFEQKETINRAFIEAGSDALYQLAGWEKKKFLYKLAAPYFQSIHDFTPSYKITSLEKRIGRVFAGMEYKVEYDRVFANERVDLFIKLEKNLGNAYKCWICFCDNTKQKVNKSMVYRVNRVRAIAREELKKESYKCHNCQAMIISGKGFTKGCLDAAREFDIELTTPGQLISRFFS